MISILYFFHLAKFFGLTPFMLQVDGKNQKPSLRFLVRIPTFLMIFFYSICICSIFWKNKAVSEISNTANWIQFIPNSAIFFIVLVAADRSRYTIQSVGVLIQELDQKLQALQISYGASHYRIKRLSIFAVFIIIFCASSISTLHYVMGVNPSEVASTFYWLSFVVAKIGLLTFNFMFALYMTVLLERLRIVGKTIEWMIELTSNPSKPLSSRESNNNMRPILANIIIPCTTKADIIENIYDIVEIVQKICLQMNSYFGKKVIFTILSAFICLTVQLFYVINNIRHSFQNENSVLSTAASCSLIFTHILELWVIFISGHRVKDMWNSLIKRVQSTKRRFAVDEAIRCRIDELVSIMTFTRVEMKAAGLFNIDLSVITSIASSIATYLIVLVQFKLSEDSTRNNHSGNDIKLFNQPETPHKPMMLN
ncbi:hypothetical protein ACKWTF_010482 [Chironomus riparius]